MPHRLLCVVSLGLCISCAVVITSEKDKPRQARRVEVSSIPLKGTEGAVVLQLKAADPDFGGISGLSVSGRNLRAITDRGHWLTASLVLDHRGVLTSVTNWRIGPLLSPSGVALKGADTDAEGLAAAGKGYLVSFEQRHRLWLYSPSLAERAVAVKIPAAVSGAPNNGGLEAIAALADGRMLLVSEDYESGDAVRAWLVETSRTRELAYPISDGFHPTDLAILGGDVLVLERRFTILTGIAIRIRAFGLAQLEGSTGRLTPRQVFDFPDPLPLDNLEGLAVARHGDQTFIYVVSDDNFRRGAQRTLLYQIRADRLR